MSINTSIYQTVGLSFEEVVKYAKARNACTTTFNRWINSANSNLRRNTIKWKVGAELLMCMHFYTEEFDEWIRKFTDKGYNGLKPDSFLADKWKGYTFEMFCKIRFTVYQIQNGYSVIVGKKVAVLADGDSVWEIDINSANGNLILDEVNLYDFCAWYSCTYKHCLHNALPKIFEVYYK